MTGSQPFFSTIYLLSIRPEPILFWGFFCVLNRMKLFYAKIIENMNFEDDSELFLRLFLCLSTIFALLIHIFFLLFYIKFSVTPLITLNILSVIYYTSVFFVISRKRFFAAGNMISMENIVYSWITLQVLGPNVNVVAYLFIILLMHQLVSYGRRSFHRVFTVFISLNAVLLMFFGTRVVPQYILGSEKMALEFFSVAMVCAGIIMEVGIVNHIHKFVQEVNARNLAALEAQAYRDPLTGMYNRRYAEKHFEVLETSEESLHICAAMADIDDFKKVNDTYGHDAGDIVLVTLSQIMARELRKSDFVFRWGGEEFLVLLNNISLENAFTVLDKIRKKVSETPIEIKDGEKVITITITIGVAQLDLKDIKKSIDECDKNLYFGKKGTKNIVVM